MRKAVILSTGMYLPERVVPNSYFDTLLGENVSDWLAANVQIYERRWCAPDESTADLCVKAALMALDNADLKPEDIDLLVIATDTPEFISPSTASVVQHRLGATNAGTFDLNTACAGFVTALDMASQYIAASDRYRHILVIGAYAMSKYLNMKDKKTVTLFADGAGAAILGPTTAPNRGYLTGMLKTKGQYHDGMGIYAGGTHQPITQEVVDNQDHLLKFVYRFPPELNPEVWTEMIQTLCARIDASPADIRQFLMTQININSIRATLDNLGLDHGLAHTIMHYYGYTGSAAIPIALHEAIHLGKVKPGDLMMLIGSGGGLAFAGVAMRY